jgi:hypothetical protein
MREIENVDELIEKVNELKRADMLDLSRDEDLSIALMNLISIEEHLYFSSVKTNDEKYLDLLNSVRELRKKLLREIVKEPEGELWCISKHLLACSMRLIEVGTKYLAENAREEACEKFKDAFYLYSLFWGLNLDLIKGSGEVMELTEKDRKKDKIMSLIKKIIDCCKE